MPRAPGFLGPEHLNSSAILCASSLVADSARCPAVQQLHCAPPLYGHNYSPHTELDYLSARIEAPRLPIPVARPARFQLLQGEPMTMKSIGTVASVATVLFCAPSLTAAGTLVRAILSGIRPTPRQGARISSRSALRQLLL